MSQAPVRSILDRNGPEPLGERVWRWVRRASVVGVAISILVHLVLWLVAGLIQVPRSADARIGGGGEVEFAVVTEAELAELMPESLSVESPEVPEVQADELEVADVDDATLSDALLSPSTDMGEIAERLGGGDVGVGDAGSSGAGAGGGAKFFGVEAQGNRFAFIVDVSGSMALEGKIEALRRALIESVEGLFDTAEFVVVAFSSGSYPLGGQAAWTDASDRGKRWARRAIENMQTMDATDPVPAFEQVTRMRPRPDAIYFMTDGEYADQATAEIINMVSFDKIPVHCISFVNAGAATSMREIAKASGGTYTHVPGAGQSPWRSPGGP
ncbi:MAG: VWA domain-containing protein [Phycisphaerales bacterium]|nr:VWA domain-containing protein [Phycisphaerales bacterium]